MKLQSLAKVEEELFYFNGFHDGFIKKISVFSEDEFISIGEQQCTGKLSLKILFSHFNYDNGKKTFHQKVEVKFTEIKSLSVNFSGISYEWSVDDLKVIQADTSVQEENDFGLKAILFQKRLKDEKWVRNEDISFIFKECEFMEL